MVKLSETQRRRDSKEERLNVMGGDIDAPCVGQTPWGGVHKASSGVAGGPDDGNMLRDEVRGLLCQPGWLYPQLRPPQGHRSFPVPNFLVPHIFWNQAEEDAKLKCTLAQGRQLPVL